MKIKGAINEEMAKKNYPCGWIKGEFEVKGYGKTDRLFLVESEDEGYGLAFNNMGIIGTKEEITELVGEDRMEQLLNVMKRKYFRCLKCRRLIISTEECYCEKCKPTAVQEDMERLSAFTEDMEMKDSGYIALSAAIIKRFIADYERNLDRYVNNPFDKSAIDGVKSLKNGEGWLMGDEFALYTMDLINPKSVMETKRKEALERRDERFRRDAEAKYIEASKSMREEVAYLEREIERLEEELYEQQTKGSEGREGTC